MVEEMEKTEIEQPEQNDDVVKSRARNDDNERDDLEEGEIAGNETKSVEAGMHPLEHSWKFWFDNPRLRPPRDSRQTDWGSSMRPIHTFSHIEDFWSLYNNIHHPSKLPTGADLYCFKNHIEPKWEDPICANGGNWTAIFPKGKTDNAWMYTLLAMIGEQFDHGDEICGAVVNVRTRQEKISLWTKNAANQAAQESIGKQWKEFLDYNVQIGFIFHDDARRLDKAAKSKYTV